MHPSGKDALTGTVGMPGRGKQGCCVICLHTSSLEIQLLHQSQEQNLHPLFFRTLLPLVKGIVLESGALPQLEGFLVDVLSELLETQQPCADKLKVQF